MSFFRRDRTVEASTLTMARDVAEIVAIVAAGIWAFYVFRLREPDQAGAAAAGRDHHGLDGPRRPCARARRDPPYRRDQQRRVDRGHGPRRTQSR